MRTSSSTKLDKGRKLYDSHNTTSIEVTSALFADSQSKESKLVSGRRIYPGSQTHDRWNDGPAGLDPGVIHRRKMVERPAVTHAGEWIGFRGEGIGRKIIHAELRADHYNFPDRGRAPGLSRGVGHSARSAEGQVAYHVVGNMSPFLPTYSLSARSTGKLRTHTEEQVRQRCASRQEVLNERRILRGRHGYEMAQAIGQPKHQTTGKDCTGMYQTLYGENDVIGQKAETASAPATSRRMCREDSAPVGVSSGKFSLYPKFYRRPQRDTSLW